MAIKYMMNNVACNVCGNPNIEEIIRLEKLPITGVYRDNTTPLVKRSFDQSLIYCDNCNHLRLANILYPEDIYSDTYYFRTSESKTASNAADIFLRFIRKTFNGIPFERIVEFGCNDGYVLKQLKSSDRKLLGVDLIWAGKENEFDDDEITVSGKRIENVDFNNYFDKNGPDFIFACHTIEHISEPYKLFEALDRKTSNDTVFALEFPCFDNLFENMRFDQIFHQHINYFTLNSVKYLLDSFGAELIDYKINYNHWGTLIIIFKKNGNIKENEKLLINKIRKEEIRERYNMFKDYMRNTKYLIKQFNKEIYGYGAALMLPILGYHLGTEFEEFVGIIDDNPLKEGMAYQNLPVKIISSNGIDFSKSNILLTAIDNRRQILKKLYDKKPRRIINPLPIL